MRVSAGRAWRLLFRFQPRTPALGKSWRGSSAHSLMLALTETSTGAIWGLDIMSRAARRWKPNCLQEDSQPLLLCLPSKDFQLGHDDAMISLYQWPMISDQRPARISDQWSVYISSSVLLALNMPSPCLLLLAEASRQLMDPKGCEATETLRSSVSIATCVIIIVIICNAADLLIVTTPISA